MTFPKIFQSSTFLHAALGAILLWAALPPVDFWPLAWIAPIPWIMLTRRKELVGPKPYLTLWIVGFVFWLAALHWLRLPHPMTSIGWLALAFYFAFYLPFFIGITRIAVHRLHLPVMLAAPVVWTGLELARAHLLTGMSMASIAHTQYRWIELIQIADLAGEYGVCFVIVFVAACIARMLPGEDTPRAFWPLIPAATILATTLGYGFGRTSEESTLPGPRIALIQGSIDTQFGGEEQKVREDIYKHYFQLSIEAAEKYPNLDLIVWPETYFIVPLISYTADAGDNNPAIKESGLSGKEFRQRLQACAEQSELAFAGTTNRLGTSILVGLDTQHFTAEGQNVFNSAAYVSKTGKLLGRYDKMHRVMFGEYIPLAEYLPFLYKLTPLSMGITPGKEPVAMELEFTPHADRSAHSPRPLGEGPGVRAAQDATVQNPAISPREKEKIRIAPNICYESVLSHVIRSQVNRLQSQGQEPDILINLSNDGWFWGSSELDMHLVCGVFRAVECRKPFLIAANTGFSASIDASGRILAKGPRRETATLLAEVRLDRRRSFYLQYGDWPAGICLTGCIFFLGAGFWHRWRGGNDE